MFIVCDKLKCFRSGVLKPSSFAFFVDVDSWQFLAVVGVHSYIHKLHKINSTVSQFIPLLSHPIHMLSTVRLIHLILLLVAQCACLAGLLISIALQNGKLAAHAMIAANHCASLFSIISQTRGKGSESIVRYFSQLKSYSYYCDQVVKREYQKIKGRERERNRSPQSSIIFCIEANEEPMFSIYQRFIYLTSTFLFINH